MATVGSRADGMVSVVRDYKKWKDKLDDVEASKLAKEKCGLGAELFSRAK
ncbi:MAG: hypothetical protein Rpha_0200 [Candidatus Ruthia sp. Apha_13_S6]|nr:hypothetical protein [Candidatus Ruthia sp. Apha_13_S6]